ncbi:MAG: AAA family ATPase, partial [uncultured bacterium]
TFIFEAFAREIDFNIIKFKKIRSQWYGQTDIIFEKIKSVLTSIGKVVVLIDEADTAFGGRSDTTHETEKRLFGNIIQMMGNPQNRGKIIWILITSRPDMLEPDIKRSGRAGLHLPVFDPQGEDRLTFIKGILKEINININNFEKAHLQEFLDYTAVYSLADFNELKILLKTKSEVNKRNLKCDEIIEIAKDFNPSNISKERRYQTLVAASECTFKSLLPPDLRDMERVFIEKELLRQELGY